MQTNQTTLEATGFLSQQGLRDVAAWREGYIQHVEEVCGGDAAVEADKELSANPWLALKWFIEDTGGPFPC